MNDIIDSIDSVPRVYTIYDDMDICPWMMGIVHAYIIVFRKFRIQGTALINIWYCLNYRYYILRTYGTRHTPCQEPLQLATRSRKICEGLLNKVSLSKTRRRARKASVSDSKGLWPNDVHAVQSYQTKSARGPRRDNKRS